MAGKQDKLVAPHHVYSLYKKYKGSKSLSIIQNGNHNTRRPEHIKKDILKFVNFIFFSKKDERLVVATVEDVYKTDDSNKKFYDIQFNRRSRKQTRSGMK